MSSDTPQQPDLIMSPTMAIIKILNSTAGQLATGLFFVLVIWMVMMLPLLEKKDLQDASDQQLRTDLTTLLNDAKEFTAHSKETAILLDKILSERAQ